MENEEIKKIILQELPRLMEKDPKLREAVLRISREHFAPKAETRDRFDQLLEEIRQMRLESERKWEENQQVIRRMIAAIEKVDQKSDTRLGALGARWGLYTEQALRNALRAMLKEFANLEVVNVVEWDATGEVFGYPEEIELDLIIKNGLLILGEIKSSVSKGEMYQFEKKARFYEKLHNLKADRLIVVSPMVDPKALEVAQKLGIEIYTHSADAGEALSEL